MESADNTWGISLTCGTKIPTAHQLAVKAEFWAIFDDISKPAGQPAVDQAQGRIDRFADKHRQAFSAAVTCIEDDRQALTAFLRFPPEHWKRIRHTNLIERTFGETRRRVKVIGRMPGEASCLSLVWAVLDRASNGWRCLRYTPATAKQLTDIRNQLHRPDRTNQPDIDQPTNTVTPPPRLTHRTQRVLRLSSCRRQLREVEPTSTSSRARLQAHCSAFALPH